MIYLLRTSSLAFMVFLLTTSSSQAMEDNLKEELSASSPLVTPRKPKKALTPEASEALMEKYLHSGDDKTKRNVRLKDPSVIQFIRELQNQVAWNDVERARSIFDPNNAESCLKFTKTCDLAYRILNKKSVHALEASTSADNFFYEYLEDIEFLRKCVGFNDEADATIEEIRGFCFLNNLVHYFRKGDFEESQSWFFRQITIDPELALTAFISAIKVEFFEDYSKNKPKVSPAHFEKACAIYEAGLKAVGLTFETYNPIHHVNLGYLYFDAKKKEKTVKHIEKALKGKWPSLEDKNFLIKVTKEIMLNLLANIYFENERYVDAEKLILQNPPITARGAFVMAFILAKRENWIEAYSSLQKAIVKPDISGPDILTIDRNEFLPIIELLMDLQEHLPHKEKQNFKKIKDACVAQIKNWICSLEQDLEEDFNKLISSNKKKQIGTLIRKALTTEMIMKCTEIVRNFDQKYKKVWSKTSQISTPGSQDYLKTVDEVAVLIEETYAPLQGLLANFGENFQLISSTQEKLKSLYDMFELETNQVSLNVRKEKERLAKLKGETESFQFPHNEEPVTNLKKEYGFEKEKDKELAGASCEKHEETNLKKGLLPQGQGNVSELCAGKLLSFSNKDDTAKNIWSFRDAESHSLTPLEQNALNLMESLNQARHTYHLRQLLRPGTKLEMLRGARAGQLSLHINDQYRLCFRWVTGEGAYDVEIVDYH